ncbi:MAG: 30S ribosomal protein S17 [Planctomycetes bacterium]|nr:30S ribosomal protein S17 [Planctomycetota bacterium]
MTDSAESTSTVGDPAGKSTPARRAKTITGTVRSDKMQKTIIVDVVRLEKHRQYHKFVRRRTSYMVHDEKGEARAGDVVRISETRPLSKRKRWRLIEIVRRGKSVEEAISLETAASQGGEP